MANVSMHSTQRVHESSRWTPPRVVGAVVLVALTTGGLGLLYCYYTTPQELPPVGAGLFPRLPMHPF